MPIPGLHLTRIGGNDFLLEPSRSLNIPDQDGLITSITARLMQARATRLYYDLSNLMLIDPLYYEWLDKLARSTQAVNVRMICINMQPTAAFALAKFIRKMPAFETALSL